MHTIAGRSAMTLKGQTQKLYTLLFLLTHWLELSHLAASSCMAVRENVVIFEQLYVQLRLKGFWILGDNQ